MRTNRFVPTQVAALLLLYGWCSPTAGAVSTITEWNPIIVEAVIRDAGPPTIGTHVLSTVFTSAYDAWSAFDPVARAVYTGNALDIPDGTEEEKAEAVSHAIYHVLSSWTPTNQSSFDQFMADRGYSPESQTRAAVLGRAAAQAVMDARLADGANRSNGYADTTGYQPRDPSIPDAWQPLTVNGQTQRALTPHWGHVQPFAVTDGAALRPPPPADAGSQVWEAQLAELINHSANLTDRQKAIVEYWRPLRGTPPMLLADLTAEVSALKGFDLDDDVKLFFAIHNAMFDAGICCWDAKFTYDYVRPITAIRGLGDVSIRAWGGPGMGTLEMPASEWHPYQPRLTVVDPTPPFPEYTSGHSTFSAAWAEIMESFTGGKLFGGYAEVSRLVIEDATLSEPVILSWPTFRAVADEAGISRLYGGIHWPDGNMRAQEMGTEIGEIVWQKSLEYFYGGPDRLRVDITRDGLVNRMDMLTLMSFWQQDVSIPYGGM